VELGAWGLRLGQDQLGASEHDVALWQKVAGRQRSGGDRQGLASLGTRRSVLSLWWLQSGLHLARGQGR